MQINEACRAIRFQVASGLGKKILWEMESGSYEVELQWGAYVYVVEFEEYVETLEIYEMILIETSKKEIHGTASNKATRR